VNEVTKKKVEQEKSRFGVVMPTTILETLKEYADQRGVPTSSMAVYIIAEFLKREHNAVERIQQKVADRIFEENKDVLLSKMNLTEKEV
jgi:hypothetical protein